MAKKDPHVIICNDGGRFIYYDRDNNYTYDSYDEAVKVATTLLNQYTRKVEIAQIVAEIKPKTPEYEISVVK